MTHRRLTAAALALILIAASPTSAQHAPDSPDPRIAHRASRIAQTIAGVVVDAWITAKQRQLEENAGIDEYYNGTCPGSAG